MCFELFLVVLVDRLGFTFVFCVGYGYYLFLCWLFVVLGFIWCFLVVCGLCCLLDWHIDVTRFLNFSFSAF